MRQIVSKLTMYPVFATSHLFRKAFPTATPLHFLVSGTPAAPMPPARTMNAQFFSTKRAHHGILRMTRKSLAHFGLTAARFDMLYAIRRDGCLQSSLRRILGVTAPVVSRMLHALEELRLVTRVRSEGDRRQRRVGLTVAGRHCLRRAFRKLGRRSGAAYRALMRAITFGEWRDPDACFRATCNLDDLLRGMRKEFGDTATLHYPWHPDD